MTTIDLPALLARARETFSVLGDEVVERGEVSLDVPAEALPSVASWLRDEGPFELLADHSAIDWLGHEPDDRRFCICAQLASVSHPSRIRLRVWLTDGAACPTLTGVWIGADALEREMFDFFGIRFEGHPALRRMFMPDEWVGHPQRKDEPLGGVDVWYQHGESVTSPDGRADRATATSGFPGRTA